MGMRGYESRIVEILDEKIDKMQLKKGRVVSVRIREGEEDLVANEFEGIDLFFNHRGEETSFLLRHRRSGILFVFFFGQWGDAVFKTAITRDGMPPHSLRHQGYKRIGMIEGGLTDVIIEEGGSLIWRSAPAAHHRWGNRMKTSWKLPTVPMARLYEADAFFDDEEDEENLRRGND